MGDRGLSAANRPRCSRVGCNRRAYVEGGEEDAVQGDAVQGDTDHGFLCYVCDSTDRREWARRRWTGPVGRPRSSLLQQHLDDEPGHITLLFLFGDGWSQQCLCTRCERPWLDAGWVCPVDRNRRWYLRVLDRLFHAYPTWELGYVDWDTAVRLLHDMSTDEIPWDIAALLEMARSSARRVSSELGEMHPDERGGLL